MYPRDGSRVDYLLDLNWNSSIHEPYNTTTRQYQFSICTVHLSSVFRPFPFQFSSESILYRINKQPDFSFQRVSSSTSNARHGLRTSDIWRTDLVQCILKSWWTKEEEIELTDWIKLRRNSLSCLYVDTWEMKTNVTFEN